MLSGSLAAVAGAVFFLSERTRAAAAAAAILPSAVAAISSLRIGARIKSGSETSHFQVRGVVEGIWGFGTFCMIRIRFLKDFYPDPVRTKFVFSSRIFAKFGSASTGNIETFCCGSYSTVVFLFIHVSPRADLGNINS
jgi:hypothetical protein